MARHLSDRLENPPARNRFMPAALDRFKTRLTGGGGLIIFPLMNEIAPLVEPLVVVVGDDAVGACRA